MIKVNNLINNNDRAVANQFVIYDQKEGTTIFQSYESIVCIIYHTKNTITFGVDWDYSRTTMKHLNNFIREYASIKKVSAKNIRQWIDKGEVKNNYCTYTVNYNKEVI